MEQNALCGGNLDDTFGIDKADDETGAKKMMVKMKIILPTPTKTGTVARDPNNGARPLGKNHGVIIHET